MQIIATGITMTIFDPSLLSLVLAGGRSSRMGTCKAQLQRPDGATFLQHAIERLRVLGNPLACSLAADQSLLAEDLPVDVSVLYDEHPERGPVEGLRLAMEFAITLNCTGVIVTPVDTPQLKVAELNKLQCAFSSTPDQIVCGVSERTPDRVEPLIAIYPIVLTDEVNRLADSNDRSLYRFIKKHDHQCVLLLDSALRNVNHPDDLTP